MNKAYCFVITGFTLFAIGCATAPPYELPILKERLKEFPAQFNLNETIQLDVVVNYDKNGEESAAEQKAYRQRELQTAILSGLNVIYRLPRSRWAVERISNKEDSLCTEDDIKEAAVKQVSIKKLCTATGDGKWQSRKSLSAQDVKEGKLDKLIFNNRGLIQFRGGMGAHELPLLTFTGGKCVEGNSNCSVAASKMLGDTGWRADQTFTHRPGGFSWSQVVWRTSDWQARPGVDGDHDTDYDKRQNPRGLWLEYEVLTPSSDRAMSVPVVSNLNLANYMAENVPLLKFEKYRLLKMALKEKIKDYYLDAKIPDYVDYRCSYDESNSEKCKSLQVHEYLKPSLGKEEINDSRESLWAFLLLSYSSIESKKRGDVVYIQIKVDWPQLIKELEIKPRKYLLTPDYQKKYDESFVTDPDAEPL